VIEAFACEPPADYVAAMAGSAGRAPVWINLEYLSAEAWVAGCHGLPSPHPRLPLLKHFLLSRLRTPVQWRPAARGATTTGKAAVAFDEAGFRTEFGLPPRKAGR
jgi:hypothetical protein